MSAAAPHSLAGPADSRPADPAYRRQLWAAAAALCAAGLHLGLAPEHFAFAPLHGAFFVAVAVAQGVLAWAVLARPTPAVLLGGVVGTLAVICTYVVSRTVGVQIGVPTDAAGSHHSGEVGELTGRPDLGAQAGAAGPESVGLVDLVTLASELALLVLLVTLLPVRARRVAVNLTALVGVSLWVLRWTGPLS